MIKNEILVVEDDKGVRSLIAMALRGSGYKVLEAETGEEACRLITSEAIDLMILDLGLPDMDGVEIIRSVRQWSHLPILVVSARTHEQDKIDALDLGADDYLTKPFGTGELLARTRTSLRRSQLMKGDFDTQQSDVFKASGLTIDYIRHKVTVDGEEIHLTQKEFRIISVLAKYSGRVLTYDYLMKNLWGPEYNNDTQTLRVYMAHIRRKIEKNPATPKYIMTEVGIGYRMIEED